jgi:lysyl-tRNA synthetase, class II
MASIDEIRQARLAKLEYLSSQGIDPYPVSVRRDYDLKEVRARFGELEGAGEKVFLAGRILSIRIQGKIAFVTFDDGTERFQAMLKMGEPTPEKLFELFEKAFDMGDFWEIGGTLFTTRKDEQTILVEDLKMLSKSLRPLPEKWHGLEDVETRFRERELDILSDSSVKERFIVRAKMISAIRRFLDERGFLEFETPVLQSIPGGANAKPFVTHHNALDIDLYLRIATEIPLKRLIVAGYQKVYEIGRLFRNEGIDHAHNPEFTTLEMYWAYVDKDEYLNFLEEMLGFAVKEATGKDAISYRGREINFKKAPRITFRQAVLNASGIDIDKYRDPDKLIQAVREKGISVDFSGLVGIGEYYDQLFKKTARANTFEPTWILDYPVELKPLANRSPEDKTKSASAQLIIGGDEIINAYYHELNDPIDQRARFEEQENLRTKGSEDAQRIDEQFLRSLEYGMPPTAGVGLGIDRLAMLLTNTENIKEVITFPTMRPKSE